MAGLIWSTALTLLGLTSLFLVPVRPLAAYFVLMVDEVVWVLYAIITGQYPFVLSALAYAIVATNRLHYMRRRTVTVRLASRSRARART